MASDYVNIPAFGSPSWKKPVATVIALPATNNQLGDARTVTSTNTIYVWSGSAWVATGGGGGGSGTVTSVSVTTANGVSGTVANPTTTPAISLTVRDASASQSGLVNTLAQTFAGDKSFQGTVEVAAYVYIGGASVPAGSAAPENYGIWAPGNSAFNFSALPGYEFCALLCNVYFDNNLGTNTTVDKARPGRALNVIAGSIADGFQCLHYDIGDVAGETARVDFGCSGTGLALMPQGFGVSESVASPRMGVATLSGGAATVSTSAITANSRVFLTCQTASSPGFLSIANINASASFDIVSSDGSDASTVAWIIVEPI